MQSAMGLGEDGTGGGRKGGWRRGAGGIGAGTGEWRANASEVRNWWRAAWRGGGEVRVWQVV